MALYLTPSSHFQADASVYSGDFSSISHLIWFSQISDWASQWIKSWALPIWSDASFSIRGIDHKTTGCPTYCICPLIVTEYIGDSSYVIPSLWDLHPLKMIKSVFLSRTIWFQVWWTLDISEWSSWWMFKMVGPIPADVSLDGRSNCRLNHK